MLYGIEVNDPTRSYEGMPKFRVGGCYDLDVIAIRVTIINY
jgi:hypothetical protein